ncbi:hypothetical protein B0T20DRAFT_232564 [Sordaria brevicollis]|uniref:Zn(2)-C6 fungal-type domain-containing protein n=1 Tax=Sordaria brevicollis TaxID=83679 RepID=A0AAE0PD83_SORBR|nr:hypothetical protein B0T20DRAFT_232564 [Sordaria brevicollis]
MHSLTSIMALNLQPREEGLVSLPAPKANQACISCRKQKRKCDKSVPTCGLCARMSRQCDYSDSPSAPTANDVAALQARLAELENRLKEVTSRSSSSPSSSSNNNNIFTQETTTNNATSSQSTPVINGTNSHSSDSFYLPGTPTSVIKTHFPPSLLLDIDIYKWASHSIPPSSSTLTVPPFVYSLLTQDSQDPNNTIQEIATTYFSTVHLWFPFISRKRMTLGHTLHESGPDLAMLFLAMKLVVTLPREGMDRGGVLDSEVYGAAKRMLGLLEASGCVSLLGLQAMVLVAVYEYGQGIMPAAWMTVGACARYAELCGLPGFKESSAVLGPVATWTESEERRRVWWAIYTLDRVICLGNKKRFVMPEPEKHYLLPVDDDAWDNGDPGRALSAGITTPLEQPQGRFARLVQSSMLVSRTITHARTTLRNQQLGGFDHNGDPFDINELDDLINTLTSFSTLIQQELLPSLSLARTTQQSTGSTSSSNPSPPNWHFLTSTSIPLNPPYHHQPSPSSLSPPFDFSSSSSLSPSLQPQPLNPSFLPPLSLTHSALFLLYDIHCCPENLLDGPGAAGFENLQPKTANQLSLQVRSVAGLRSLSSGVVRDLCMELLDAVMLPQGLAVVSPLCLDSLYSGLATLRWLWTEGGDTPPDNRAGEGGGGGVGVTQAMEDVSKCLGRLGSRWRLAEEYLGLVGYHDVGVAMAWKPGGRLGVPC